ncbi:MAG: sugar transferase, partial [Deltaproteobacteria bacterium]|nr:sugar transferase [Deltaproteobacteria bacterium]
GGGPFYRAERVGKGGRAFILNKFRTMRDGGSGPLWTEKNDARITPIGRFLRATHLDELPQLWNIIRGDISFTGPRPENAGLVREYEKFSHYGMRHVVKPGLTGWAQINYKPSASLEEAYEKLKYDLYYVKNRSLVLDLLIILKTVKYLFMNHS